MAKKKTWAEKLDQARARAAEPRVFRCPTSGVMLLIPSLDEIEEYVSEIPSGSVASMKQIAEALRGRHQAEVCCPLTTGIFAWILAHAAVDAGKSDYPWWRLVKAKGELNPKYPGGPDLQAGMLKAEGKEIVAKRDRLFVVGVD